MGLFPGDQLMDTEKGSGGGDSKSSKVLSAPRATPPKPTLPYPSPSGGPINPMSDLAGATAHSLFGFEPVVRELQGAAVLGDDADDLVRSTLGERGLDLQGNLDLSAGKPH